MKLNFRMSRRSFTHLCGQVEGFMSPEEETVRNPIPLIMRVTVFSEAVQNTVLWQINSVFTRAQFTETKSVYIFSKGMMNEPIRDRIQMPGEEEASEIACDDVDAK